MHESAWYNAKVLGASVYDLHQQGITWAMISYQLEVHHLPLHEEVIEVSTYPAGHARSFVYRDYHAHTPDGQRIASASSTWLVLDLKTRHMTKLRDFMFPLIHVPEGREPLARAARKLPALTEATGMTQFRVRWHELDPNGHATNVCYLIWSLESLPLEFLAQHQLVRFAFSIQAETQAGEYITASWQVLPDGERRHLLTRSSDGKTVAQAVSHWRGG